MLTFCLGKEYFMSKELTEKQQMVLQYIREKIAESGFPPTIREIGDRFGITVKGAYDHIKAIEKKGYIKTFQNKSRAIVVTDEIPDALISIPLLGRIAAGSPILAEENVAGYINLPFEMVGNGEFFALTVHGDSMIEAGILDGDTAIIKSQEAAESGEIVAALIEDEATLKVLDKNSNSYKLLPCNPAYAPIEGEFTIIGKLAALFRQY